jgi:D-amino-acid dehydrogenase
VDGYGDRRNGPRQPPEPLIRPVPKMRSRALVVGGGIVGLSCAFFLRRAGYDVTVLDRDPDGDRASLGNAGAIAQPEVMPIAAPGIVWKVPRYLLDPLGPLSIRMSYMWRLWPYLSRFLRAANKRQYAASAASMGSLLATAFDDHGTIHQESGLGHLLNKDGHLWVYRSPAVRDASPDWQIRERQGLACTFLDRDGLVAAEPALGPMATCAVRTDDWATYVDPKAYVVGLMAHLRERGVAFKACHVASLDGDAVTGTGGQRYPFDHLVIAAGAWSHRLSVQLGDWCPLETERGYNTTLPNPGVSLNRMVTFAEDHFVATPMSTGLRIGGAVEFAGLEAPPNFARSKALLQLAAQYLPDLNVGGGNEWMGHRPSTPDSLPVIGRASRHSNILYAFGHGHLGLTGSATTGRLIAALLQGEEAGLDLTPFRIGRFSP